MAVKYQVERRPIGPTGKVYRGIEPGDNVAVLSNPTHKMLGMASGGIVKGISKLGKGQSQTISYVPFGEKTPELKIDTSGTEDYSHVVEVNGEPWLVHSTHFSIESALESAAPLAGAIGKENVRIVKVLSHTTLFKLN